MKRQHLIFNKTITVIFTLSIILSTSLLSQTVVTMPYTGGVQTFTVPSCVTSITVDARGAQGGDSGGGLGGRVQCVYTVTPGDVLSVYVGGQGSAAASNATGGFNGGGNAGSCTTNYPGSGGGGATDIRLNGNTLTDRIIVAGGGGGWHSINYNPGAGGGLTGGNVSSVGNGCILSDATGGSQSAGGNACTSSGLCCTFIAATNVATLGIGGDGAGPASSCNGGDAGAGGGGGYYGGGGGGTYSSGGGGSSYTGASAASVIHTQGFQSGNGVITFTYIGTVGVTANASSNPICAGSTVTLTAVSMVSYTWLPVGSFLGSNTAFVAVSPTTNTTYSLNGTNLQGCVSSAVITVSVNSAVPTLTVVNTSTASGATGVCAGKSVTLTASGALTYTWTGGVTNALSFTPAATSNYTVLGTNACGTRSAVTSVSVIPLPIVGGSASSSTVCSGGSITLTGSGGISYTWSPTVTNGVSFVPPFSNNYTVTGTGAAGGCTNNAVVGVTVFIFPTVPPIASPTAICIGSSSTLSALGATGYTWTASSGPALTGSVVVVSPTTSTTYTLSRLNSACPSTATLNLVVNTLPTLFAFVSPTLVCAGSAASLSAVGGITYTWFPGGFSGSNPILFPLSATSYTAVGSNANCTNSAVVSVATNPIPTISIVPSTTLFCQGGSNTATLTANGAVSYTWQTTPNLFTPAVSVSPLIPTLYTVIGSNSFNCTSSQQQLILVTPSPSLSVASSASYICTSGSAVLIAFDTGTGPGTGAVNYQWNTGATTPSIGVSPSVSTNYTVTGTYVGSGCQSTTVVVLPVFIATFAVTGSSTVCQGSTVNIIASGAAANYLWNTGATTNSISVSPSVPTTYSITGSTGLCSSTQTVGIIVNPLPPVTAIVAKQTICRFEQSVITATGASSYSWAGVPAPVTTAVLTYSAGNNGYSNSTSVFTVTGTDANGCSKSAVVTQLVATCIGIENLNGNENSQLISVYPNPNNGHFSIESTVAMQVKVINNLGQVVKTINLSESTKQEINVSNLANGIYLLVGENEGKRIVKR
jgi:hypothetical protein